jgi:D-psicose/D-tagatose/L-ribulose 3-epimerase
MVKFGVTSWLWFYPFSPKAVFKAEENGFDGIEIPVEDLKRFEKEKTAEVLNSSKIECSSICSFLDEKRDIKSNYPDIRKKAKDYIRSCIDFAVDFGAKVVAGPLYSAIGPTLSIPDKKKKWKIAVAELREVARYAEDRGIYLGLEPINRFENCLVNTVSEALEMLDEIDNRYVGIHFDTFHANIEEKSVEKAIIDCGSQLIHFHCCENDRGTPGTGHVPWNGVADALKSVRYDKYMVIETMMPGIRELSVAASIWRDLAPSMDSLAKDGLKFLKNLML